MLGLVHPIDPAVVRSGPPVILILLMFGSTVTRCCLSVWNPQVHPLGMWCVLGSGEGLKAVVHTSASAFSIKRVVSISLALAPAVIRVVIREQHHMLPELEEGPIFS